MSDRSNGGVQMYEELHIMTPVLPTRELSFLRYCRQIDQGLWAIADVSADMQRDVHFGAPPRSRRLPSGCLIADMANGYSKVCHDQLFFSHTTGASNQLCVVLTRVCFSSVFAGDLGRTHGDRGQGVDRPPVP
jgi:hypothetical protein